MAYTTTTTISAPVNNVFQQTLLRNARVRCPYFVGSQAAVIMEHSGTFTAKWRRIENLSANTTALSELTGGVSFPTRISDSPTITDYTATLSKYGNFIFLNEEVDLLNDSQQMDKLVEILGINAGQSLNRLQRNKLEDDASTVFAGTATVATTMRARLTANAVRSAGNILQRNSALKFTAETTGSQNINTTPIRDAYWLLVHVDTEEDVRDISGFVSAERYASQVELAPGEIGSIGNARVISTEDAGIDAGGAGTATSTTVVGTDFRSTSNSNDLYTSILLGKDAHGSVGLDSMMTKEVYMAGDRLPGVMMIAHDRGTAGPADPLNEVSSLGWKSWHAAQILNPNWVRRILHCATLYQ